MHFALNESVLIFRVCGAAVQNLTLQLLEFNSSPIQLSTFPENNEQCMLYIYIYIYVYSQTWRHNNDKVNQLLYVCTLSF